MKTAHTPTAAELNGIHAAWMNLDILAPEKVKNKVFKSMEKYPKIYISLNADKTAGVVMHHGNVCHAKPISIEQCLKYQNVDKVIAWHGETGTWVNLDTAALKIAKGE